MKNLDLLNDNYAAELPNGDVELVLRHRRDRVVGGENAGTPEDLTRTIIPAAKRPALAALLLATLPSRLTDEGVISLGDISRSLEIAIKPSGMAQRGRRRTPMTTKAVEFTAPIVPPHHCDCGSYGDKKDSSGWSCPSCREALKGIGLMIEKMINRQRAELFFDERLAHDAEYRERYEREHRDEILLRHRNYNKARRLRLKAMNIAPATSFAALGKVAVLEAEQRREAA